MSEELPAYTEAETKAALLAAGASGTIYSLVMPESEAALEAVIDDRAAFLDMYREAMVTLEERSRAGDRLDSLADHLEWLQSEPLTEGSTVPFHREAQNFRTTFDQLILAYDAAMTARNQKAVRGRGESW